LSRALPNAHLALNAWTVCARSRQPRRFQQDADAALTYLCRRPDVRIGVIGVSLGGEVAIRAAARRPQWRATVL